MIGVCAVAAKIGKLAGKTEWAGRRRPATRRAGFSATFPVQLAHEALDGYRLAAGNSLSYDFHVPNAEVDEWVGFGGWFAVEREVEVALEWKHARVLTSYEPPNWNKVGTLLSGPLPHTTGRLTFTAKNDSTVTTYSMLAAG